MIPGAASLLISAKRLSFVWHALRYEGRGPRVYVDHAHRWELLGRATQSWVCHTELGVPH